MSEYENVPEGYEADTEEFDALYVLAWLLIIRALMTLTRLPPSPTSTYLIQKERQLNLQISEVFRDLNSKAIPMATKQVTEAYMEGVKYSRIALAQETKLTELKETDVKEIELNDTHTQRLNKMVSQTQDDLLKATGNTEENVKKLVRKVVSLEMSTAARSGMIGKKSNMGLRIEQQLRKQLIEKGLKDAEGAIVDRANRTWRLRTYSQMVARTKMNNAYIDAIREEALQDGTDLAIISTKPNTYDECKNYEGMIISLNGLTAGYLTYEGIKATKACFHPNCGHFVRPVSSLSWVPKEQLKIHENQMDNYRQS